MIAQLKINKQTGSIVIHLLIALLCVPMYQTAGELIKIAIAPYVLYLLFRMEPKYIPALMIHFMDGTSMSFLILLGCLFITVLNIKKLMKLKLGFLLLLSLLPFPYFLYTLYLKLTINQDSLVVLFRFLFMYFGLFPFFYFVLIAPKLKRLHLKYIIVVLALAIIIQQISLDTVRYIFFSIPVFFTLLVIAFKKIKSHRNLFFISFILVLLMFTQGTTSTLIFTSVISAFISYYYLKKKTLSEKVPYVILTATLLILFFSVSNFNPMNYRTMGYNLQEEELNVLDYNSVYRRAKFKLFEDRTPLWYSIYYTFIVHGEYRIPLEQNSYDYYTIQGTELESEIPAHNIYLELIKNYGIITGMLLSIVFIIMIIKSSLILRIREINIYQITIASSIIACGFFGGMTGQYLLLGTFSFLFMGLAGMCYGIYNKREQSTLKDNMKQL